jgi:pimeloyl-ACP methyl ester carboxylesterase
VASTSAPALRSAALREGLARRAKLWRQAPPQGARGPSRRLLLGELSTIADPLRRRFRPPVAIPKSAKPRVVMLLPGFGNHPVRMRFMARELEAAGHTVKRWGLGFNLGPSEQLFAALDRRVSDLHARYGEPVVLVGWSLGGLFAREIAKRVPGSVAKVISLGSPFSGSPYANNVWRIYQLVTGHSVDEPPVEARLAEKPPVETVALWSPRDGIVSPRSACGRPGERDRAVALRCTHLGFAYSHEAIRAVAAELERE